MKKENYMDVVFLLDRSGSMFGSVSDTIGGYNGYIESFRDKKTKITTVLFDNHYEMLTERLDVSKVPKLTEKEYNVRGCTALLDAIGKTIEYMDKKKSEKVIFIITTDGLENASIKYDKEQIKELIQGHTKWEFIYVGADIDSYKEGESIGIDSKNIANYKKDKKGISKLFASVEKASSMYMEDACIDYCWKQELEDYIDENEEIN